MNEIVMSSAGNTSFLAGVLEWGIEIIRLIQKIQGPFLTTLVKIITEFGTGKFYVPVILFIFWWLDEKRGLRFGILIIVSAWINALLKILLKQPRPFHLEPSLGLAFESSYGAPSGHAQMSLCFWIPMAAWYTQAWADRTADKGKKRNLSIWALSIFIILFIGFTRLYLGVHFPTDLLAGWVVGGIILTFWFFAELRVEKLFAATGRRFQNISVAVAALAMNSLYPMDKSLPALFLGFCLGYNIMRKAFPFYAQANINGKKPGPRVMFLRCLTGFLGAAILYLGLKLMLPGDGSLWTSFYHFYELGRFIRYDLLGFWVSAGAPWVFRRLGLSSNEDSSENSNVNPGENPKG